jgi:effector-binding domain-containing protein
MRSAFLIVMSTLILGAGYLMLRNGVFLPVTLELRQEQGMLLLGADHIGAYHKILPTLEKVETWARQNGLSCSTTFGEYIDDPNVVEMVRLRSFVGCVIDKAPTVEVPADFRLSERPLTKSVVATFRGSPALGPYKVYGKAHAFMQEHQLEPAGPVIELYRTEEDGSLTTVYLFPVK